MAPDYHAGRKGAHASPCGGNIPPLEANGRVACPNRPFLHAARLCFPARNAAAYTPNWGKTPTDISE